MSKLRELASDTMVYGISSVVARFVNYLLVPLHTALFVPADYVIVGLAYGAIALLNVFFTFGFESSYLKYSKDREQAPSVFKSSQLFLGVFASVLVAIFILFRGELAPLLELTPDTMSIFWLMATILWLDSLMIVPFAELRVARRTFVFAWLKMFHVGVNVGLNLFLLLVMDMGVAAVFWSNAVASALTAFLVWNVTAEVFRKGLFEGRLLWQSLAFAWPFIPAGIGHAINEMFDRFFLAAMPADRASALYGAGVTPEEVAGIYNGSYKLAVFMLLFIQMFRMAWQPFFMRHSDNPRAPRLFARAFTGLNLVAALIFLAVGLFVKEIASVNIPYFNVSLLSPDYHSGLFIVPILLAAYWLYGWYIHFSAAIYIQGNTKVFSWIMIAGATVTIVANTYLVPPFGMLGAAFATLLSYLTMALLLLAVAQSRWPVPYRVWTGLFMIGFLLAGVWFENQMAALLYDWNLISTPDPMKWKLWFGGVLFVMLLVAAWRWRAKAKVEEIEELVAEEEYSDEEVESDIEEADAYSELGEDETIQEDDEDESNGTESNDSGVQRH